MDKNEVKIKISVNGDDTAKRKAVSVGRAFKNVGRSITGIGKTMTIASAPIIGTFALAAKTAIDFEDAFAGVRKTVDASEADFDILDNNLRVISSNIPVTYEELAKIMELAGQLGVSGANNLTAFTSVMAKMAVTTNLTSEEAATSFARIANIMAEPIENVDKMASVVVDLGNNFATTEREIVEFANRIAGAGKIAGLQTQNLFAIGAAMSSVGIQAEAGGTAVQKVLINMTEAVTQGTDNLELFAKTAGVSAKEFGEMFEEDAMAAFTHFVEGLGKQGDNAIATLDEMGLKDQRLVRAMLSLSGAGELLNKTYNKSAKAWGDNIALTEEANKRFATTKSFLQILGNKFKLLAANIGEAILPVITELIEKLGPFIEKLSTGFEKLPNAGKKIVLLFGVVAVVIGPLLIILGTLISAIGSIIGVIGAVSAPVLIVIAAVGLLIGVFVAVAIAVKKMSDKFGLTEVIMEKVRLVIEVLKQTWEHLKEAWKDPAVQQRVEELKEKVGELVDKFEPLFEIVKGIIEDAFDPLNENVEEGTGLFGGLSGTISFLVGVVDTFIKVVEFLIPIVEFAVKVIIWLGEAGMTVYNVFKQVGDFFLHFEENMRSIWEAVKEAFRAGVETVIFWLSDLFVHKIPFWIGEAIKFFGELPGKIPGILLNLWQQISTWFMKIRGTMIRLILSAINRTVARIRTLPGKVMDCIKQLPTRIRRMIPVFIRAGESLIRGLWKGIKDRFAVLQGDISKTTSEMVNSFKAGLGISSPSTVFMDIGKNVTKGLAMGLQKPVEGTNMNRVEGILSRMLKQGSSRDVNFNAPVTFGGQRGDMQEKSLFSNFLMNAV